MPIPHAANADASSTVSSDALPLNAPAAKPRLREIIHLSSFAIVLVVFGHSENLRGAETGRLVDALSAASRWVGLFHMPLFFAISGYLFLHTRPTSPPPYLRFISSKVSRLLLPYLVLSSIAFPPKAMLSGYARRGISLSPGAYAHAMLYPRDNPIIFFWFIGALFVIFLFAPLLWRVAMRRSRVLIILTTALLATGPWIEPKLTSFFAIDAAVSHILYFWIGMLLRFYISHLRLTYPLAVALVMFVISIVILTFIPYGNVVRIVQALIGMWMSYNLIVAYTRHNLRLFAWIDGYSYQIYLLSWFVQQFVAVVIYKMLSLGFWPSFAISFIGAIAVPVLIARFVKRWTPWFGPAIGLDEWRRSAPPAPPPPDTQMVSPSSPPG